MAPQLWESSINLDLTDVEPVVKLVAKDVEQGFSEADLEDIVTMVRKLKVEEEAMREFHVVYRNHPALLKIQVVMDDINSPDFYFFSDQKEFTDHITTVIVQYMESQGR